jgi:glycosyltransferase involved in cell wall biosynthesis
MKVGINALAFKTGGGLTYLKNLLPALAKIDSQNTYFIFVPRDRFKAYQALGLPENFRIIAAPNFAHWVFRLFYEQFILPKNYLKLNIEIIYNPGDIGTIFTTLPQVLAIRNPNPYAPKELKPCWGFFMQIKIRALRLLTKASVHKASKIIFVSDYSRKLISQKLKIPLSKTTTIHHGIDASRFAPGRIMNKGLGIKNNYILSVSNLEEHKNFEILLSAYAQLPKGIKNQYQLKIAGGISMPSYFARLKDITKKLEIETNVKFLGKIPYENLPALYQRASLFVLPSLLETFGHPVLEAQSAGLPVILARSTSLPEVGGQGALYFAPRDPKDLAQKITQVLTNPSLQQELIQKASQNLKRFSWNSSAQKLIKTLKSVAK